MAVQELSEVPWLNAGVIPPARYICGHCGAQAGSNKGYQSTDASRQYRAYICTYCSKITMVESMTGRQTPGARYGYAVEHVPPELARLYDEARDCMSVSAYTAAVLLIRKLLMNIAVQEGAQPGLSFVAYITYLETNHYITAKARPWVDHIRTRGNQATHEIPPGTQKDAQDLIEFAAVLLKGLYEFPAVVAQPTP